MMDNAKDDLVDRRTSEEFEGAKQEAEKLIAEIEKRDAAAVKEQIEGLTRTHRMFKGVVAKT